MIGLVWCLIFFLFAACGKHDFPDYTDHSGEIQAEETPGVFRADFTLLNRSSTNALKAHANLWIKERQFYIRLVVSQGVPDQRYQQYLHLGERCPTLSQDDRNQDGKIDFSEVLLSSGNILIPLDGSLKSQSKGSDYYPKTSGRGKYSYSNAVFIHDLLTDLFLPDDDPTDAVDKLPAQEELDLSRRTIILYGSPHDPLLPVACALIKETI